tara:strand:+ start:1480 stop:2151 length:672 start_codon:yes stop_codon:yes gene_type:complete
MQKEKIKKINWKKVKITFYKVLASVVIITSAFGFGTFKPNHFVVEKIETRVEVKLIKQAIDLGLHTPNFVYSDDETFIAAVNKCVAYLNYTTDPAQRIPTAIIIAMAGIESAWGNSRFATEGNALFGVRTWSLDKVPHMKAKGNPNASWGVKKYENKCNSIKDMIAIINRHPAYKEFRIERDRQRLDNNKIWNYNKLMPLLSAWSTNEKYANIILRTIKERNL